MDYRTCLGKDKIQECPIRHECIRHKNKGNFESEEVDISQNGIPFDGNCIHFKQITDFNDYFPDSSI